MRKITETDYLIDIKDDFPERENFNTNRYNGGWAKEIIGINKEKSNGYSLIGDFLDNGKEGAYRVSEGKLYLDCNIDGSRKNQKKEYTLFTILNNKLIILDDEAKENKNWAIDMWPAIEKHFNSAQKIEKDRFFGFTDNDLLKELSKRGYDVSLIKNCNHMENSSNRFSNIELE